jgi:hypothetical protein
MIIKTNLASILKLTRIIPAEGMLRSMFVDIIGLDEMILNLV